VRTAAGGALATLLLLALAGCGGEGGGSGGGVAEASGPPGEPGGAGAASAQSPERYGFGRAPSPGRLEELDVDVLPDGTGLPPGSGSVDEGAAVYRARCAACHGPGGRGGAFTPLVSPPDQRVFPDSRGPRIPRTVGNYWPRATSLYEYVARAMPMQDPGTLTPDQVYAVVAWILHRNGIVEAGTVLDAGSLPGVEMPARDRFVRDSRTGGPGVR